MKIFLFIKFGFFQVRPIPLTSLAPVVEQDKVPPDLTAKVSEPLQIHPFRTEDMNIYDKPFLPKPIPHSPKISPSSIPNPSPSVISTKPVDSGYPNYGGYLCSVPGFSAFQPVGYPGVVQPNPAPIPAIPDREYNQYTTLTNVTMESIIEEKKGEEPVQNAQMDFEEHFTPEVVPAVAKAENNKTESIMSIASLVQGSGATVCISSPPTLNVVPPAPAALPIYSAVNITQQTMITSPSNKMTAPSPTITTSSPPKIPTLPLAITNILPQKAETVCCELKPSQPQKNVSPSNQSNLSSSNVETTSSQKVGQISTPTSIKSTGQALMNIPTSIIMPPPQNIAPVPSPIITLPPPATAIIVPPQPTVPALVHPLKEVKKKPERFSLKTSIPISKIDMKSVNPPDPILQKTLPKKAKLNSPAVKADILPKIEIQSDVIIKSAMKEPGVKTNPKPIPMLNNSISALLNAAEVIHKSEIQFRVPEPKQDLKEIKDLTSPQTKSNPNTDKIVVTHPDKPQDSYGEQKNQIVFIQNKSTNPKMMLTIQQQNPQVLLQRTNFDSKNLQTPSRLTIQSKKGKDDTVSNKITSNVVALKKLHQDDYDENDFENLITENQIYGNMIVVKEKSHGTLQDQDLAKNKVQDKLQTETKNVVLQSNFVYLNNVQFPGNVMMIKNNTKSNQISDINKTKGMLNENKVNETNNIPSQLNNSDLNNKSINTKNASSKDIHFLKSNRNLLQTPNKSNKSEIVIHSNQKVIVNKQMVYQMPVTESDNKMSQTLTNIQHSSTIQKNETRKQFDNAKNDKLYIACPYQMDSKSQPKIVITSIRPKSVKSDEVSSLDIYEKKKEMKRLKYLSKHPKDFQKGDKKSEKNEILKNTTTPLNLKSEIYDELMLNNMRAHEESNDSGSDYDEEDLKQYEDIIREYGDSNENYNLKANFLANLNLTTPERCKELHLDRQERSLRVDSVASAYIAVGRLDRLNNDNVEYLSPPYEPSRITENAEYTQVPEEPDEKTMRRKQVFLSQMKLLQVTPQYKEEYERTWRKILRDRKRRYGTQDSDEKIKLAKRMQQIDPNSQLQLLSEIKNCVNENNNLIKKRLDSICSDRNEDSIRILAEKNFSELNRLSKMADRSVKILSGQDTKKRDLNPGFDSENIQKKLGNIEKYYPSINIPNISKIIALKTVQETPNVVTTQATSMDEPQNSAAGVDMFEGTETGRETSREVGCQVDEAWPGLQTIMNMYKEHVAARKREIADLHRRNTNLRVEGVHITRAASCESDKAQVLLAERQHLALEENRLRTSIQRLLTAIEIIKNS